MLLREPTVETLQYFYFQNEVFEVHGNGHTPTLMVGLPVPKTSLTVRFSIDEWVDRKKWVRDNKRVHNAVYRGGNSSIDSRAGSRTPLSSCRITRCGAAVSLGECELEATGISGWTDNKFVDASSLNSSASRGLEFPGVKLWFAGDLEDSLGIEFELRDVRGRGPVGSVRTFDWFWGMCPVKLVGTADDDDWPPAKVFRNGTGAVERVLNGSMLLSKVSFWWSASFLLLCRRNNKRIIIATTTTPPMAPPTIVSVGEPLCLELNTSGFDGLELDGGRLEMEIVVGVPPTRAGRFWVMR